MSSLKTEDTVYKLGACFGFVNASKTSTGHKRYNQEHTTQCTLHAPSIMCTTSGLHYYTAIH